MNSRTAMTHCYKHLVPCSKRKSINRYFSVCHYITTLILAVGIHPPEAFFLVLCCCFLYPGLGHSGVSPSGCPFALPSDDTQNDWDSESCRLPVFTGSDIGVGGFLPYVTVCCSGQNLNEGSLNGLQRGVYSKLHKITLCHWYGYMYVLCIDISILIMGREWNLWYNTAVTAFFLS